MSCFETYIPKRWLHCFITRLSPLSCVQARLIPTLQLSTVKGLLSNKPYWFVTKLLWHYDFNRHWQYIHPSQILYFSWKALVLLSGLEQSDTIKYLHSKWEHMFAVFWCTEVLKAVIFWKRPVRGHVQNLKQGRRWMAKKKGVLDLCYRYLLTISWLLKKDGFANICAQDTVFCNNLGNALPTGIHTPCFQTLQSQTSFLKKPKTIYIYIYIHTHLKKLQNYTIRKAVVYKE